MKRLVAFALAAAACGGSKPKLSEPTPGETHDTVTTPAAPDAAAAPGESSATRPAPPPPEGVALPPPPAGNRFELKNEGTGELLFGVTRGWGPVIFAYTGKPPKAKSVTLFESACTASCDAAADQMCPVCPQPQTKKEELALSRTEKAAPGESVSVPWDGKIRVYEKASQGKRKCKCFRAVDPPADSYTVKACGLRPPREPGKASKPVCSETKVTLGPGAGGPQTIALSFK